MNHCPVYHAVGGHAYGWVYPGPMGAVLTPSLIGVDKAGHLPNASTFCGRCESVCPVRIPLPKLMRHWREREFERHLAPATVRYGLGLWAYFARRPRLYAFAARLGMGLLALVGKTKGRFRSLPFAGGLDAVSRFSGAAGWHVPVPMEEEEQRQMTAREEIFSNIRRSLGVRADDAARRAIVRNRIEESAPGIRPQRGEGDVAARTTTFRAQAESVSATIAFVDGNEDVPAEVARFLRDHNLPTSFAWARMHGWLHSPGPTRRCP